MSKYFKYKVSNNGNPDHFDIVGILSNGAFASTSPHTAANGFPCKDILAVYKVGYCEINIVAHFHNIYYDNQNIYDRFNLLTCSMPGAEIKYSIIYYYMFINLIYTYFIFNNILNYN